MSIDSRHEYTPPVIRLKPRSEALLEIAIIAKNKEEQNPGSDYNSSYFFAEAEKAKLKEAGGRGS